MACSLAHSRLPTSVPSRCRLASRSIARRTSLPRHWRTTLISWRSIRPHSAFRRCAKPSRAGASGASASPQMHWTRRSTCCRSMVRARHCSPLPRPWWTAQRTVWWSARIRSIRSTKAQPCSPAPRLITCHASSRTASTRTSMPCRRMSGSAARFSSSVHRATRPVRWCRWRR